MSDNDLALAVKPDGKFDLPDRILDKKELRRMWPVSDMTIWRWERDGKFPKRLHLGQGRVGWRLSELLAEMDRLCAEREAEGADAPSGAAAPAQGEREAEGASAPSEAAAT